MDQQGLGMLAAVVFGHHGGLPSRARVKEELAFADDDPMVAEAIRKVGDIVPEIHAAGPVPLPEWFPEAAEEDPYALDLLVRMVYSTVVDADYLDTEEHFAAAARPPHPTSAADLADRFEQRRRELLDGMPSSPIDGLREEVYRQCREAALGPRGIYRLPAPTGSGKTLAAGGFALHHARRHGMRRVLVAVPFMSITEQNADVYRGLLERAGEGPVVLEHHSGVDLDEATAGGRWRRLAAENWDAPFVVTTTVRLFESLFSTKPAALRRVHRLAGSVIVLDEVQALPDRLLVPITSALRGLSRWFGVTVLLASATQPPFERLSPLRGAPIREVVRDPKPLYAAARDRVRFRWLVDPKPTMAQIAEEAAQEPQVLVVVNTTRDSGRMHELVEEHRPALHLSTRMAAAHRRVVLEEVKRRLADHEPIALVSTQLVEAGVDLDFPAGFRAAASADSLQQAAGRVNRSGHLPYGRVTIFDPEDGNKGARLVYGPALEATLGRFGPHCRPDDTDALEAYYQARFDFNNVEEEGEEIQHGRRTHDFPVVAALFRMIDEWTVPVAVRYGNDTDELDDIVAHLRSGLPGSAERLRALRPYLAALPKGAARRAVQAGLAAPIIGDLVEWLGDYHPLRGIDITSPDPQELVF
jgi:CRISPR-associated endonuclease/helicase Cas3